MEAAADGLLVFDAGGRLTLVNAAAEQLLGVPQADILGATYGEVAVHVGIDVRDPPAQLAAALAARQPLPPTLVTLRQPDGTPRSVQVSGRPPRRRGATPAVASRVLKEFRSCSPSWQLRCGSSDHPAVAAPFNEPPRDQEARHSCKTHSPQSRQIQVLR